MGKYFGTDGARGVAGKQITGALAYRIGRFIGQSSNGRKNKILIARDTRISGQLLADAVGVGIVSSGSDVYNIGVSTTPSVSYIVRKHGFDYGVMISASHNPYYDNGIKVFNAQGEKLEAEIEDLIEGYIDSPVDNLPLMTNDQMGRYMPCDELLDEYVEFLVSKANPKVKNLKVFIDCSNGSSSAIAPKVLEKLGVNFKVVANAPDGLNINDHCGSTHIENDSEIVKEGKFDIGFAFDGDADRCLALSDEGHVIDGDQLIYLNALNLRKNGKLSGNTVVITVMSNLGLKKALTNEGIEYHETTVGDKYVQMDMKENKLSIGGEQSGHIIFLDDLNTGDGVLTMIHTLNVIAEEGKNIKELISKLKIYPQSLKNVTVTNKEAVLSNAGFKAKVKELEDSLKGNGRILARPSGTEPKIRVMCEAPTQEECEYITSTLAKYVEEIR